MTTPRDGNDSYAGPILEVRAASTAGGGTALSSTAAVIHLPNGINLLHMIPHTLAGAVVVKYALNPYLAVFKTADALATITDYSSEAQDADTSTDVVLSSLGTFAQNDFLMVGSHLPFRGAVLDVDSANGNASVLTVKYWNGSSWADITASDGTASGGVSLAQDGNVTWTVPSGWTRVALNDTTTPTPSVKSPYMNLPFYWTRWEWSAALDSSTTLNSLVSLSRSTAYGELVSGLPFETAIKKGLGGIGCVEALTDAGTAYLIVNVGVRPNLPGIGL